jgi:hypothetical protein
VAETNRFLSRAAEAKRSSKRVELDEGFDPQAPGVWLELVRDIAAMANSGGGVVVLNGDVEEEQLHEQLARHAEPEFEAFELHDITRTGRPATAIVVEGVANTPLVFTRTGRYRSADGDEHVAFARGGLYFRHGARSEPATGADVRDFIKRQLDATRSQWLANIRQVMHAPDGAEVAVIETAERDDEGRPTLIRLTTDPHAPLYGQVDPDRARSAHSSSRFPSTRATGTSSHLLLRSSIVRSSLTTDAPDPDRHLRRRASAVTVARCSNPVAASRT